jgi:XTP/dITP diphosphohydrolase
LKHIFYKGELSTEQVVLAIETDEFKNWIVQLSLDHGYIPVFSPRTDKHVIVSFIRKFMDDSGLEVEALRGAPGVYSARYAGAGCSFADNNHKLLDALTDKRIDAERLARFRCVMALVDPAWGPAYADAGTRGPAEFAPRKTHPGRLEMFEGRIDGVIAREPQGAEGFGYDPVFFIPAEGCTMAELSTEQKNRISHRAQALKAVRAALLRRLA